jgi:hypothetical protein
LRDKTPSTPATWCLRPPSGRTPWPSTGRGTQAVRAGTEGGRGPHSWPAGPGSSGAAGQDRPRARRGGARHRLQAARLSPPNPVESDRRECRYEGRVGRRRAPRRPHACCGGTAAPGHLPPGSTKSPRPLAQRARRTERPVTGGELVWAIRHQAAFDEAGLLGRCTRIGAGARGTGAGTGRGAGSGPGGRHSAGMTS